MEFSEKELLHLKRRLSALPTDPYLLKPEDLTEILRYSTRITSEENGFQHFLEGMERALSCDLKEAEEIFGASYEALMHTKDSLFRIADSYLHHPIFERMHRTYFPTVEKEEQAELLAKTLEIISQVRASISTPPTDGVRRIEILERHAYRTLYRLRLAYLLEKESISLPSAESDSPFQRSEAICAALETWKAKQESVFRVVFQIKTELIPELATAFSAELPYRGESDSIAPPAPAQIQNLYRSMQRFRLRLSECTSCLDSLPTAGAIT